MLLVALLCLLLACLFLVLEIYAYGGFGAYRGALSAVSPAGFSPFGQFWC
jgi:hypothetical protein